ncbi:MAG: hypothetical protein COB08_017615 [Rhodobacteraceae bacterium]|nr:hypothetical protein [Paracoccaceae bacterium]
MSFFKSISGVALALSILSSAAQSGVWDAYTSFDTLYSRGYWRLDLNQHSDGSRSCESRTVNGSDYVFNMFTLSTGDYVIQFENEGWGFGTEELNQEFVVEIDRRGAWNIDGTKWSNKIRTIVTPPNNGLSRFFNEVARGNTLYLRNDRGIEIARFSLRGTSATLNQHRACERRIFSGFRSNDPFN